MTYQSEVLADSPWGYWRLQEASGTTLADASPNGRNMAIVGTPTLNQVGPVDKAIAFTAELSQHAETAATIATSEATVEAWVYLTAQPVDYVGIVACANSYGGATTDKVLSVGPDGLLRWHVYDGATRRITTGAPLSLNTWHHVVASVGAAGCKIRVDKVTEISDPSVISSHNGAMKVFVRGGGDAIGGTSYNYKGISPVVIAEPAIYTTQLSDARTDAHYAAAGPVAPSPITVAGEPFAVAVVSPDGTHSAYPVTVGGEAFVVTTTVRDGYVAGSAMRVTGEPFTVATTTLDGTATAGAAAPLPVESTTDRTDRSNGRTRVCEWTVEIEPPVTSAPRDRGLDESQAYSISGTTLVDGRPT